MQTPKTRNSPSGGPQRTSPRSTSTEALQKNSSPQAVSVVGSLEISPGVKRQLKPTARCADHTTSSSSVASRAPKERSPKIADHKSPRSPASEHPGKVCELESQICHLENELKTVKDHLCSAEASKNGAQKTSEESNEQLLALSEKLEDCQNQLLEQLTTDEVHKLVLHEALEGHDLTLQYELETIQKQYSHDLSTLASALNEIKQLKFQLQTASVSEATQVNNSESTQKDFDMLKENFSEAHLLVEEMTKQVKECKESETQAQNRVVETSDQLEMAKVMVETLGADGLKTREAYEDVATALGQSKSRAKFLEELVSKLEADIWNRDSQTRKDRLDSESEVMRNRKTGQESIEAELTSVRAEVEKLRSALEAANVRSDDEQTQNAEKMRKAGEMLEHIQSASGQRVAELEAALKKSQFEIEELKSKLFDKETELQGISKENDGLTLKLENTLSGMRENELEKELVKSKADVENLKAQIAEKESEWQSASGKNETLKMEIKKITNGNASDEAVFDLESAGTAEREALLKIGYMMEEVDKSDRRAARVAEQLEAAQAANTEMEMQLRRLKVQSDQWRKAAEAATAMLSAGNNNGLIMDRTGLMQNNHSPQTGNINSPYEYNAGEDLLKKKNANVLKRFGVVWKKQQK